MYQKLIYSLQFIEGQVQVKVMTVKHSVLKARGYMTPGILEEDINEHEEESLSTICSSPTAEAEVEACEEEYRVIAEQSLPKNSSVLLLDEVLLPLEEPIVSPFTQENPAYHSWYQKQVNSARQERDHAILLARHYRNKAEESVSEKRTIQHQLESKVEVTRNFWRNKIIEGNSSAGKILRAALICNTMAYLLFKLFHTKIIVAAKTQSTVA